MKVALVYDRVNKFGGAERVLLALHRLYPDAPLYTLVYDPPKAHWAKVFKVIPTFLNSISFLRSRHEILAPIAPMAFETLRFDEFDLVISVTSSDAKAIITKPQTRHICYCLTPTRWFFSGENEYTKDIKMKVIPKFLKHYFRTVDILTSSRPDLYIAISKEVKKRIKLYYRRSSVVIHPPIDDKFYSKKFVPAEKRGFYLLVSRLVPYKRADLVIKAFNKLRLPLVVIGSGSQLPALKRLSTSPNTKFLGQINDRLLIDKYRHAKAVIYPQFEDYGLVPIEAQACGTPVIAFARGGALETVKKGITGLFFKKQNVPSLIEAVEKFRSGPGFRPEKCLANAKKFSLAGFDRRFSGYVDKAMAGMGQNN